MEAGNDSNQANQRSELVGRAAVIVAAAALEAGCCVRSANNEHFVPIGACHSVRDPSLTPSLPYLASLPDTGDRFGFSPSQVCGASH